MADYPPQAGAPTLMMIILIAPPRAMHEKQPKAPAAKKSKPAKKSAPKKEKVGGADHACWMVTERALVGRRRS